MYLLVHTVRVFRDGIGRMFGIGKCVMLVICKAQIVRTVGIELPDDKSFQLIIRR